MPSIFLSHNSRDKPFVRWLAERLAQSGVTVWLDEAQLKIGDSLIDKISEAIQDVEYVGVVISSNSVKSPWVQKELSLAMSKEIKQNSVVVLPVLIDECRIPESLSDKLYADFRSEENFDRACNKLLDAMGIDSSRENHPNGLSIEWSDEGPRISGYGVVLSATESSALLDRWTEWLPKYINQEAERLGKNSPELLPAANVLAVMRACADTYNRIPEEGELEAGESELARKYNLFYHFSEVAFARTFENLK